jgi:hypothetical protein
MTMPGGRNIQRGDIWEDGDYNNTSTWLFDLSNSFILFSSIFYHSINHCMLCMHLLNLVYYVFLLICSCISILTFIFLIVMYVLPCVFCLIVLFCVLFVYKCLLHCCHRVSTQLQSTNEYHIISYHIISYHIIYHIISYHTSYHFFYLHNAPLPSVALHAYCNFKV